MILRIDDWEFDIDITQTMAYSAAEAAEHCDCAYCRNFYASVDAYYPQLRPFLGQFGLNIEAPEELFPYDIADQMIYEGSYRVFGSILRFGESTIPVGDVDILPAVNEEDTQGFILDFRQVTLPWELDEPMTDTLSPANDPSFLNKMWARLLEKADPEKLQS